MIAEKEKSIYRRVLLKLSGEALQDSSTQQNIDLKSVDRIVTEIAHVCELGVEVALVVGGGNVMRGVRLIEEGFNRITADKMGMMATIINGLALRDAFKKQSISTRIYSAISIPGFVDAYDSTRAARCLKKGRVAIFVGGTGNPLVTTDTAAALRGIEINADILLKATKVDGVYAADPIKNPKAELFKELTYDNVIEQKLAVMDYNSILLCRDNSLPIRIFNMNKEKAFQEIVLGKPVGTSVSDGEKA